MKRKWNRDDFWLVCKYSVVVALIAIVVRGFLFVPIQVEGRSMQTTLNPNDWVLVESFSRIKRFDVIVFQLPDGNTYIKRVIGLPGEQVAYRHDQLFVNNQPVAEPFLKENQRNDRIKENYTNNFSLHELLDVTKLGKDSYFVMGDNRRVSKDSRSFGAVTDSQIIGKAIGVYYPIHAIKPIR